MRKAVGSLVAGISDPGIDCRVTVAAERGNPIHFSIPDKRYLMEDARIPVAGTLEDLLKRVDVVVDCTPKGIGAKNQSVYEKGHQHTDCKTIQQR